MSFPDLSGEIARLAPRVLHAADQAELEGDREPGHAHAAARLLAVRAAEGSVHLAVVDGAAPPPPPPPPLAETVMLA